MWRRVSLIGKLIESPMKSVYKSYRFLMVNSNF